MVYIQGFTEFSYFIKITRLESSDLRASVKIIFPPQLGEVCGEMRLTRLSERKSPQIVPYERGNEV
jgi:hypothetical protein